MRQCYTWFSQAASVEKNLANEYVFSRSCKSDSRCEKNKDKNSDESNEKHAKFHLDSARGRGAR